MTHHKTSESPKEKGTWKYCIKDCGHAECADSTDEARRVAET